MSVVYNCDVFPCSGGYWGGKIQCYENANALYSKSLPLTTLYRTSGDTERFVQDDLKDACRRFGIRYFNTKV